LERALRAGATGLGLGGLAPSRLLLLIGVLWLLLIPGLLLISVLLLFLITLFLFLLELSFKELDPLFHCLELLEERFVRSRGWRRFG
jgi:hypothetical protein